MITSHKQITFLLGFSLPWVVEWQRARLTKMLIKRLLMFFHEKRQQVIETRDDWDTETLAVDIDTFDFWKSAAYFIIPGQFKELLSQSILKQCIDLTFDSQTLMYVGLNLFLRDFDEEWKDEDHFMEEISDYKLVYEIPRSTALRYKLISKSGIERFFTDVVGMPFFDVEYVNIKNKEIRYSLNMDVLKNFEHRHDHVILGGKLQFKLACGRLRLLDDNLTDADLRRLMVSFMVFNNIRYHGMLHIFSNNFNYFLVKNIDAEHPVMRFLSYIRLEPFGVNEVAVTTLLAPSGFAMTSNLSVDGLYAAVKYFQSTKPFEQVCNPGYGYDKFGIPIELVHDMIAPILPEGSVMRDALVWWKLMYDYAAEFFENTNEDSLKEFIELMTNTREYQSLVDHNKSARQNTICICAKLLYMGVAHEMMSNRLLCMYASNPYILPSTLRKGSKTSNVASTIRAASLWNSTNMPSSTFDDEKWVKLVCRTKEEREVTEHFQKGVRTISEGILRYSEVETSIRW